MATRTWKLGEIARGGVITAEVKGSKVTIIGKDWDFSSAKGRGATKVTAKRTLKNGLDWKLMLFLHSVFDGNI